MTPTTRGQQRDGRVGFKATYAVYPAGMAPFTLTKDIFQKPEARTAQAGYEGVVCFDPADPQGRNSLTLCSVEHRFMGTRSPLEYAEQGLNEVAGIKRKVPSIPALPPEARALVPQTPEMAVMRQYLGR